MPSGIQNHNDSMERGAVQLAVQDNVAVQEGRHALRADLLFRSPRFRQLHLGSWRLPPHQRLLRARSCARSASRMRPIPQRRANWMRMRTGGIPRETRI